MTVYVPGMDRERRQPTAAQVASRLLALRALPSDGSAVRVSDHAMASRLHGCRLRGYASSTRPGDGSTRWSLTPKGRAFLAEHGAASR